MFFLFIPFLLTSLSPFSLSPSFSFLFPPHLSPLFPLSVSLSALPHSPSLSFLSPSPLFLHLFSPPFPLPCLSNVLNISPVFSPIWAINSNLKLSPLFLETVL